MTADLAEHSRLSSLAARPTHGADGDRTSGSPNVDRGMQKARPRSIAPIASKAQASTRQSARAQYSTFVRPIKCAANATSAWLT